MRNLVTVVGWSVVTVIALTVLYQFLPAAFWWYLLN